MKFLNLSITLLALSLTGAVFAQGNDKARVKKRCEKDSLNDTQAFGRIDWTLHCARADVLRNWEKAGLPKNIPYAEIAKGTRESLTMVGKYPRKHPMYPSFATGDFNRGWVAPTAIENDCRTKPPAGYSWNVDCVASCYTPEERLLYSSGYVPIGEAMQENLQDLQVVSDEATLGNIRLKSIGIEDYINSLQDTDHTILELRMASGGSLKVTPNHPLLNHNGYIKLAETFKVGDALLTKEGDKDPIVSIEVSEYHGKVYNVMPKSAGLKANVLVAEGYLAGSAWYQNEGASYISRRILRESVPSSLFNQP